MTWDELRSEAFGEIGLRPYEFYPMEHEDYWLLHKGFFNKRIYDRLVMRDAVMMIIAPHLKTAPNGYQLMPLPGDKERREAYKEWQSKRSVIVEAAALERLAWHREQAKNN